MDTNYGQPAQFNSDMILSAVNSDPNLRDLVGRSIQLMAMKNNAARMQQYAQQNFYQQPPFPQVEYQPTFQQATGKPPTPPVVQNPPTPQPQPQNIPQQQQGGNNVLGIPNVGDIMSQAMGIVARFEESFKTVNENVKQVYAKLEELDEKLDNLTVCKHDDKPEKPALKKSAQSTT